MGQFGLLEKQPLPAKTDGGEKSMKVKAKKIGRLPDARGHSVIGGFAEKKIAETRREHICRLCGKTIPIGSPAREITEVVNGKLLVSGKEYFHKEGQCPPITD